MFTRRNLLASASAAALLPVLRASAAGVQPSEPAARLNKLMDAFFLEDLNINPESATLLGLDKGDHAVLKSRLSDQSAAGIAARRALNADQLKRLKAIDPAELKGMDRVNYDTLLYTRKTSAEVMAFDFGGTAFGPSPYAVSQLTGAYQSVPDFLDTKHKVDS